MLKIIDTTQTRIFNCLAKLVLFGGVFSGQFLKLLTLLINGGQANPRVRKKVMIMKEVNLSGLIIDQVGVYVLEIHRVRSYWPAYQSYTVYFP